MQGLHNASGQSFCCCPHLKLWFVPHEGLSLESCCFERGWGVQSTTEQDCIYGDHRLQVYTYCIDHTSQVVHLHVHPVQRMQLAASVAHWSSVCCTMTTCQSYHALTDRRQPQSQLTATAQLLCPYKMYINSNMMLEGMALR